MDLGIKGRTALICASSKGLGLACAIALAREGCRVFINGRDEARLVDAVAEIECAVGKKVTALQADIAEESGREVLIAACPDPDILINNNHGPSPGNFVELGHDDWIEAVDQNMLAPLLLIRAVLPGMRQRKFGRIVNITSAMVKSPHPSMELSCGARAGLTAACKALSVSVAADNVTINNLLPERIDTDRQRFMAERMVKQHGITFEEARTRIAESLPAKRFGRPEEFGDACAYLCSAQAGFITGQNLQLDGGSYRGLV
ncbi:3-oxoacyl-[acyl-carrier protein] reductase [Bradyrhizobium sp. GM24.11]